MLKTKECKIIEQCLSIIILSITLSHSSRRLCKSNKHQPCKCQHPVLNRGNRTRWHWQHATSVNGDWHWEHLKWNETCLGNRFLNTQVNLSNCITIAANLHQQDFNECCLALSWCASFFPQESVLIVEQLVCHHSSRRCEGQTVHSHTSPMVGLQHMKVVLNCYILRKHVGVFVGYCLLMCTTM